jgi:hypothetical protein
MMLINIKGPYLFLFRQCEMDKITTGYFYHMLFLQHDVRRLLRRAGPNKT